MSSDNGEYDEGDSAQRELVAMAAELRAALRRAIGTTGSDELPELVESCQRALYFSEDALAFTYRVARVKSGESSD